MYSWVFLETTTTQMFADTRVLLVCSEVNRTTTSTCSLSSRLFPALPRGLHPAIHPSSQPAAGASAADFQNDLLQQQASTSAQHLGDFQQHRGIAPLIFLKPVVVSPAWRGLQAGNTDLEAGASRAAERSGVGTVPTCLYRGPLNRALTTHQLWCRWGQRLSQKPWLVTVPLVSAQQACRSRKLRPSQQNPFMFAGGFLFLWPMKQLSSWR